MSYIAEFDQEINDAYPMEFVSEDTGIVWMWVNEDDDVALFYDEDAFHTIKKPWRAKQYEGGFLAECENPSGVIMISNDDGVIAESDSYADWEDALNELNIL